MVIRFPHMDARAVRAWAAAGILLTALAASSSRAADPDPRLSTEVSLEVRAADIGSVARQLSSAVDVPMDVEPDIGSKRITLYANQATVGSFQSAIADLYRTTWRHTGEAGSSRYRLLTSTQLESQAERFRRTHRAAFMSRLLDTEQALRNQTADQLAQKARASILERVPEYPDDILQDVTGDTIRQALLTAPLRLGISRTLLQNGSAWVPFRRLPATYQTLVADFAASQLSTMTDANAAEPAPTLAVLQYPQARLEYRLLYGDRWTGTVLLIRAGASDNWATAMLPSILFNLPDDTSLYPEWGVRTVSPELSKTLNLKIDTNTVTWDQALGLIARAAGINVLSDSYPRPEVFRSEGGAPVVTGGTLEQTLDRICDFYGYKWSKQGDWYLFRNRQWIEQERVAVPEPVLRALGASVGATEHLSQSDATSLAALSDEQLLTLQLYGSAAGRTFASPEVFDYNDIQLMHVGLTLYSQMTEGQRSAARESGLPYLLMSPVQQYLFASTARDRGYEINAEEAQTARFRLTDEFHRERLPSGWAMLGSATMQFTYGPTPARSVTLSIRAPAAAKATDAVGEETK